MLVKKNNDAELNKKHRQSYLLKILFQNKVTRNQIAEYQKMVNDRIDQIDKKLNENKVSSYVVTEDQFL